ncbi:uncharacterized protein HD556DRAFT_1431147 [Suillus plorans]|uniref:CxC2-like cysteine cluster KDZ transposase-associated domain-containing protein n=1 Tax=Suillus plorans TaxID=116603 RepID=A0A9P7IY67_9AGAM|nr:uncharacterized protein HD556DRAFT_1431147 [Suillus plorans]KAG1797493.1 hypothetical protein HD556DRAFT_1431147 [Suillus plorans]
MSQSGCTGRPSKRPKLVRHTLLDPNQPSNHVDRHRIFSLQRSGQVGLQTSYIPTSSPEKEDKDIPACTLPTGADPTAHTDDDPWNETEYFDPACEVDDAFGAPEVPTAEKRRRRTAGCGSHDAVFHCQDCFSVELTCRSCAIGSHLNSPLHRIKEWRDGFFHPVSLKSMGLQIQLGRPPGTTCRNPRPAFGDDFVIINIHIIHLVGLNFCGCKHEVSHFKQLLRARLFPSTVTDPRTAATFAVLESFHILSFESKISAYEFFHGLARRTNNTGITPIRDCYSVFLRIVYQWKNIKALKRSGCGHNPAGVDATQNGDLAVLCPACPHLGKNLPDDWKNSPEQWKFGLFLAIDANFRLKRQMVSSDIRDPGLSQGWGYFVEEKEYKCYLHANGETVKSSCISHNAVNMADTKSEKGLAATGVGTVDCARHDMKLANGVGDLQKGEKYLNMDYLTINYFVPKFHLAAHIEICQTQFSFNWTPGVGQTDGEAPERGWANINRVASSTKEMGPGARRDMLNDHFSDWNWKKVTGLAMTQAAVRLELEQRDAKELEDGSAISLHAEVTCSVLISTGIDLEDAQRCLRVDSSVLGQHSTDIQRTRILTRRNALQHRLDAWTDIQRLYMPAVPNLRTSASLPTHANGNDSGCPVPDLTSGKEEDFQLLLPSEISNNALNDCHSQIRLRRQLYQFKVQHLRGQGPNTHARKTLDTVEEHLTLSHAKYVSAREALVSLAHHLDWIGWEHKLQPLKKAHLRPIGDFSQQTQGTAIMSWIWLTQGISSDDTEGMQESLRVEWCKARARRNRWSEEIQLLLEEMRHILVFLRWQGDSWDSHATLRTDGQPEYQEGLIAYARCQAHIQRGLVAAFAEHWKRVPHLNYIVIWYLERSRDC